jgi:hypothetical protein
MFSQSASFQLSDTRSGVIMRAFTSRMTRMHQQTKVLAPDADDNPLLDEWGGPFGVPDFGRIKPDHFRPAFARGFATHATEVASIGGNAAADINCAIYDAWKADRRSLKSLENLPSERQLCKEEALLRQWLPRTAKAVRGRPANAVRDRAPALFQGRPRRRVGGEFAITSPVRSPPTR